MSTPNKLSILFAYLVMIVVASAVSYFLGHILLQLPLRFVVLLGGLSLIAITFGTSMAAWVWWKRK
jgi:hypothetical protein